MWTTSSGRNCHHHELSKKRWTNGKSSLERIQFGSGVLRFLDYKNNATSGGQIWENANEIEETSTDVFTKELEISYTWHYNGYARNFAKWFFRQSSYNHRRWKYAYIVCIQYVTNDIWK